MLTFPVARFVLQEDYLNVVYIFQKVHWTLVGTAIFDNHEQRWGQKTQLSFPQVAVDSPTLTWGERNIDRGSGEKKKKKT